MIDIEQTSKSHGLRMNVEPEDTISGTYLLKATSDVSPDKIKLWIDGKRQETRPALEKKSISPSMPGKRIFIFKTPS